MRARLDELDGEELVALARAQEWKVHRFKRAAQLPRVARVLGILKGLAPDNLLDLGTGRGVFLWALLDAFPELPVTCVDERQDRVDDLLRVSRGGMTRLSAQTADIRNLPFPDRSFAVVTALEVLEHLGDPAPAIAEAVRVAERYVVVSVPLHADNNPEHLTLFTGERLTEVFTAAGATRVQVEYVPGHIVAVMTVPPR